MTGLTRQEWALVVIAIALVWITETVNTAVEALADQVTTAHRRRIGQAKDCAALAVLLAAAAAGLLAAFIFLPHWLRPWLD